MSEQPVRLILINTATGQSVPVTVDPAAWAPDCPDKLLESLGMRPEDIAAALAAARGQAADEDATRMWWAAGPEQGQFTVGARVRYFESRFGRITSMWPPGSPAMARIAVENPLPDEARYVTRKLRDVGLVAPEQES